MPNRRTRQLANRTLPREDRAVPIKGDARIAMPAGVGGAGA
jgi:hypothetical protein